VVYRTLAADVDGEALRARLVAGELDALTFTSPSTVRAFADLLDDDARRAARACQVAAIGPTTAEALRREGFEVDVVPEQATVAGLVAALSAELDGAGREAAIPRSTGSDASASDEKGSDGDSERHGDPERRGDPERGGKE